MADLTKIEWADATLNLWWGCTKVSDGCKFCYAEHLADHRHHRGNWGPTGIRQEVKSWRSTLEKISKRAKAEGRRLRVFCSSMSDVFEGPETMGGYDSDNWKLVSKLQDDLMEAIFKFPELDFLLLTKRPENVNGVVYRHDSDDTPSCNWLWPDNLWIGTSVEDQKTADERIPHLLAIPARVLFLSCEPLLGPVSLEKVLCDHDLDEPMGDRFWVIVGGESGPNARPMHPEWAREIRFWCNHWGHPFFFKQWGEWAPGFMDAPVEAHEPRRVGKKLAGRILDGRTWDEVPA